MKLFLKCVDNENLPNALTVGKSYEIVSKDFDGEYLVQDNMGYLILVEPSRFEDPNKVNLPPNCS
jgi:hypothetical protein